MKQISNVAGRIVRPIKTYKEVLSEETTPGQERSSYSFQSMFSTDQTYSGLSDNGSGLFRILI